MDKQSYTSTSIVNATPMNRQAYNDMRGWKLPEDEDGNDEGFLVEQLEAGPVNGHVSWMPKDVFERNHVAMGINGEGALPWKLRVLAEKALLDQRLAALAGYLKSEGFGSLLFAQRLLLIQQNRLMKDYSDVLKVRIDSN